MATKVKRLSGMRDYMGPKQQASLDRLEGLWAEHAHLPVPERKEAVEQAARTLGIVNADWVDALAFREVRRQKEAARGN